MVTELDHNLIKKRIIAILKANSNIWTSDLDEAEKFRTMEVGAPDLDKISELAQPSLFITNDGLIERQKRIGEVSSNSSTISETEFEYRIIFTSQHGRGSIPVEELLDDFQKEILQSLKANYDLRDPSAGTDPKVARSWPTEIRMLNPTLLGRQLQGRTIRLHCVAHTS